MAYQGLPRYHAGMTAPVQHQDNPFVTASDVFDRAVRLTGLRLEFGDKWDIYRQNCPAAFVAESRQHPPLLEVHYAHSIDQLHAKLRNADH
jgi:hypothetical protein